MEVDQGSLRFNPSFNINSILLMESRPNEDGAGFILKFSGPKDQVNDALNLFEYKPICPFNTDNEFKVLITAVVEGGAGSG